jgi:mannose-6-phosphate isomerase
MLSFGPSAHSTPPPPPGPKAHPNKKLAEQLHNDKPTHYKDDNHKPEMTIAVTPFEALCSFQKVNAVLQNLRACPELVAVVGEDAVSELSAAAEAVRLLPLTWLRIGLMH